MGILTVRFYDMELLDRLVVVLWRQRRWRWVYGGRQFLQKKL